MNKIQALSKAVELWGKNAWVSVGGICNKEEFIRRNPRSSTKHWDRFWGHRRYVVGVTSYGILNEIKGDGISWEDAFDRANKK